MVLSSQMPREGVSRRHMVSRRRRRRSKLPLLVVVVALGAGGWYFFGRDRDEAPADGDNAALAAIVTDNPTHASPVPHIGQPDPSPVRSQPQPQPQPQPQFQPQPQPVPPPQPTPTVNEQRTPPRPTRTPVNPTETFQPNLPDNPATASATQTLIRQGMKLIETGDLVKGRDTLNRVLLDYARELNPHEEQIVRDTMARVNRTLVFSKTIAPGDPLVDSYTVQSGDRLVRIAPVYKVPYQIIEHINGISANRIQVGQTLKVIKGPFHAVVVKHAFRLDLYLEGPDGRPVYITSYTVGLGEAGSTPLGLFRIGRKSEDPGWTNPRTGETFSPSDPRNPIGEYWLELTGIEDQTKDLRGYGIHGTIEPDSIGREASMGCIRMRDDDVQMIFNMLETGVSTVRIVP